MNAVNHPENRERIVFVTGLSGAGLSSTLKILEDLGCDVFDNFPLALLDALLEQQKPHHRPIALGIDTRTRDFDPARIIAAIDALKAAPDWMARSLFLTADDTVLLQRFTETRRTHPLARDRPIADGITTEKSLLYPLKYKADAIIDTSEFSIHDLRRAVTGQFTGLNARVLNIALMSFSYRHGLPREADIVFDMRFLHNPNWVAELKPLSGRDENVRDYLATDPQFSSFVDHLKTLLLPVIPAYRHDGKAYLTIAFGCTGGRHRSVALAEIFGAWLRATGHTVNIHHRELAGA